MLSLTTLHSVSPLEAKGMDTQSLRANFLFDQAFAPDEMKLLYTHYDRMIVGGVLPEGGDLTMDHVTECGTDSILDRREMGILNLGATAVVTISTGAHQLEAGDMLYLGKGSGPMTFGQGGQFYVASTPAHRTLRSKHITPADASKLNLGKAPTVNDRTIYQFIHPDVMESCQLVMGYTKLHDGSVWNTVPAHVHDRRIEAYLYFDLATENRVFHFMGQPQETRHIVIGNEEVVISPPWSIHCGCSTGRYSFCWVMGGDNVDYADVDMVAIGDLQ